MTHLTGDFTREELALLTERLKTGDFTNPVALGQAIYELGDVQYSPARSVIEGYLDHPHHWVRRNAIMVLTIDFKALEHRVTCERMIESEAEFDARLSAISGLGVLLFGTNDIVAARLLARIVRDAREDLGHRRAAYSAIQNITGVAINGHTPLPRHKEALSRALDRLISKIESV